MVSPSFLTVCQFKSPVRQARSFYSTRETLVSISGPAQLPLLVVQKSGRGPGIIYRISDLDGREKAEGT